MRLAAGWQESCGKRIVPVYTYMLIRQQNGNVLSMLPANTFRKADLHREYLCGGVMIGQDFSDANFSDSDMRQCCLSGTTLTRANLDRCNLWGSTLTGIRGRMLTARNADLSNADLTGADLSNADLSGAIMDGTRLHRVDFRGANMTDVDFSKSKIKDCWGLVL